jgi:hypothetical protein
MAMCLARTQYWQEVGMLQATGCLCLPEESRLEKRAG